MREAEHNSTNEQLSTFRLMAYLYIYIYIYIVFNTFYYVNSQAFLNISNINQHNNHRDHKALGETLSANIRFHQAKQLLTGDTRVHPNSSAME